MGREIAKDGSIYRCLKYCSNCPFKDNGKAINLQKGRVDSIKEELLGSPQNSFNCHKTVYNLDDRMQQTEEQKLKMCYGAFRFLLENGSSNQQMQIAYRMDLDEELKEYIENVENNKTNEAERELF